MFLLAFLPQNVSLVITLTHFAVSHSVVRRHEHGQHSRREREDCGRRVAASRAVTFGLVVGANAISSHLGQIGLGELNMVEGVESRI